jgi:two-component system response regulator BaeR
MSASILIVEDEVDLAAVMADYVRAAGYVPQVVADGAVALGIVKRQQPTLIVLDLMLPGLDGLQVCKAVRAFSAVPIIMVTARVEELDRLLGLEVGADDYLCKPFSPRELVARIKAVLRRASPTTASPVAIDEATRSVRINGAPVGLTPTEFKLFATMARRPGAIFSRAQLLDVVSGDALEVTDRAIDSHIKNLRRKLSAAAPDVELIHAVYGVGYRVEW